MFEIFGRSSKKYDSGKLKRNHALSGRLYLLLFILIAYFCVSFIISSKVELSARATFHSLFAFTILVLFGIKISIVRVYKEYYNLAKIFGLLIALLTFGMVWTSGGYYFLVTSFGTDVSFDKIMQYKSKGLSAKAGRSYKEGLILVKTDRKSIDRGKILFDEKCIFCHEPNTTQTKVGPGLKGVMNNQRLPVSKRPATPENIRIQLIKPFNRMPSFDYLSEEEITDIIAFLNTL
jgi:mono/diheme cytochrome c family protein